MQKGKSPAELAEAILNRSICTIQVGAVIADSQGVFSWGWNGLHSDGLGRHAEAHAIMRGNRSRFPKATMWVAGKWHWRDRMVPARPCETCQRAIRSAGIGKVMWRDNDGAWRQL